MRVRTKHGVSPAPNLPHSHVPTPATFRFSPVVTRETNRYNEGIRTTLDKMRGASQTASFLALCVGPLLFAPAVAADDYPAPSPSMTDTAPTPVAGSDSYDSPTEIYPETTDTSTSAEEMSEYVEETPAPFTVAETSAPTEYYVETTDGGEMDEMPVDPEGEKEEEEEEEPMPMDDSPAEGASCTTYDEDVSMVSSAPRVWMSFLH